MRHGALPALLLGVFLLIPAAAPCRAQDGDSTALPVIIAADTVATAPPSWWRRPLPEEHSPQGALRRAALVPGSGQVYNRQIYKVPFVYAGLAGIGYAAFYGNDRYLIFRRAALYAAYMETPDESRPPQYRDRYEREYREAVSLVCDGEPGCINRQIERGTAIAPSFRDQRDIFRRNRDLSYLGLGLFYGLTILDAYVSAHLLDFDVSEDLSVALRPAPGGVAVHLALRRSQSPAWP